MNIDYPQPHHIDTLRTIWQEAFGEDDAFFTHGFNFDRCRCVFADNKPVAALYWFDCSLNGVPLAYVYGVATARSHRGKGLCRALLENTHEHLKYLGYAGIVLVPAEEKLFALYEKMGYAICSQVQEFHCAAGREPVQLRKLDAQEYRLLRREYLPENGVIQEGDALEYLENLAELYAGEDFLLTVARQESFFALELLGNTQAAPGILAALHRDTGIFRCPGTGKAFAMYHPLSDCPAPDYFGLAFD